MSQLKLALTNSILNGFLLKKRIKTKFMANYTSDANKEWVIDADVINLNIEGNKFAFADAFSWMKSTEGYVFWQEFAREYLNAYHPLYYKT